MSGVGLVWSENAALFERLMEIHSNQPILYYGFNVEICVGFGKQSWRSKGGAL